MNCGEVCVPTVVIAFFVHYANICLKMFKQLKNFVEIVQLHCVSAIDSPMAKNIVACLSLKKLFL